MLTLGRRGFLAGLLGVSLEPLLLRRARLGPRVRIAFGSCLHQSEAQPIWRAIAATAPNIR